MFLLFFLGLYLFLYSVSLLISSLLKFFLIPEIKLIIYNDDIKTTIIDNNFSNVKILDFAIWTNFKQMLDAVLLIA